MASSASSLSIPLKPSEAFGVKGSLRDGVHFVEGYTFIYVASHCVIEKNIRDLRAQGRFLTGSPSMCGISAIVVSPDDRTLAVAEIAKLQDVNSSYSSSSVAAASPVISVYSAAKLSKKQSLISASAGSHEYISLSYTCDGKHLAALGGPPEWLLQLWHVRKTKVLCSIKTVTLNSTGAYQVRCCPVDKNWFTVCGDGFAKTYKMVDTDLRQVSTDYTNQEGRKVFCHSWIPRSAVKSAEDEETKAKGGKGLNGKITVVKKANKEMKLKGNEVVKCGCVYALDSGELLYVNHGEVIAKIPMQESGDEVCIVQTILPYSKGFICGENGKVSVYDYDKDHKTYKKVRSIKVEETNARVHGLALSSEEDVLICLLSTNRLIHLCFDEIDTMSADTVSKKVQAQSYHQAFITGMDTCLLKPFVVTCSKDNSVRVWNFEDRSCEILKFFPSEALSVSIHPNGLYLLVGCMDCLHLLNMVIDDLSLWKEFPSVKGCTDCAFSRGGQCFAAATGNVIHVISTYTGQIIGHLRGHTNKIISLMSSKQYNNYNASIVNGRLILPIVMISSFGCQATGLFHEVKLFAASVVKVCLSSDNFLFCASEDGLIMMFDVRIPGPQHHRWSDDVLIPKASLEDYMRRVQGLEIQAVHTEKLCEQRVKSNCDRLDEEIEDIKKQYEHTVDVARDELLALSMEKSAMELNAERKQKDVQAIHAQHLKDMEDVYNRMTVVEISRYDEFVRSKDAAIIRWTQQMKSLSKEHEVALQARYLLVLSRFPRYFTYPSFLTNVPNLMVLYYD
uniref:Cilia- and flagella-associated protein 43 n=1 Tax=Physcomitrium patens TaxID=3218 RepID=A0A2K1JZ71_PHYPA|nr:hypothetical protein PHYPA_013944 [Physcomitrium patens]